MHAICKRNVLKQKLTNFYQRQNGKCQRRFRSTHENSSNCPRIRANVKAPSDARVNKTTMIQIFHSCENKGKNETINDDIVVNIN